MSKKIAQTRAIYKSFTSHLLSALAWAGKHNQHNCSFAKFILVIAIFLYFILWSTIYWKDSLLFEDQTVQVVSTKASKEQWNFSHDCYSCSEHKAQTRLVELVWTLICRHKIYLIKYEFWKPNYLGQKLQELIMR